jgi:hypothetical protein
MSKKIVVLVFLTTCLAPSKVENEEDVNALIDHVLNEDKLIDEFEQQFLQVVLLKLLKNSGSTYSLAIANIV